MRSPEVRNCVGSGHSPHRPGTAETVGKRTLAMGLIVRIVEFSDLDGAFIEIVEQACIDAHLAEIFAERLPVGAAAADWTMVNADHSIAPDISDRLT